MISDQWITSGKNNSLWKVLDLQVFFSEKRISRINHCAQLRCYSSNHNKSYKSTDLIAKWNRPWPVFRENTRWWKWVHVTDFFFFLLLSPTGRSKTNRDRDVVEGTIVNEIAPNDVSHHSKTCDIKIPSDAEEKNEVNHAPVRQQTAKAGRTRGSI